MGRAWLQAGLKIHEQLAGREPLFFESMVSWFEQCYRGNPAYREELVRLRAGSPEPAALGEASQPATTQVQAVVESLIERLEPFCGKEGGALISVVVPVYNHYQYLQACLCSLAEQGGQALEVICIDDASPDPRVVMLLNGLTGRLPALKIVRSPVNQGVSAVQNRAVALASGRFLHLFEEQFPLLQVVGVREGQDDAERNYRQARALLEQHDDLAGIYNIGGGAEGIGRALKEAGADRKIVFIGHGLTPDTRALLIDGTMDVVITQNPQGAVMNCVRIFANLRDRREPTSGVETTRSQVIFRENLP